MPNPQVHGNYNQFGQPDYSFGIDPLLVEVLGLIPESIRLEKKTEFEAEAKQNEGMTASFVAGPVMYECTISGFLTDAVAFNTGHSFTFPTTGGLLYAVTKRSRNLTNTDFVKAEITGVHYVGAEGASVP